MGKTIIWAAVAFFATTAAAQTPAPRAKLVPLLLQFDPNPTGSRAVEWASQKSLLTVRRWKLTPLKAAGLLAVAVGGMANGALQAYHFDGDHTFENRFGASKAGFWGSESWRKRYRDGDPAHGLASPLYQVLPVFDFQHTAQFVQNHATYGGGFALAIGGGMANVRWRHFLADAALMAATNTFCRAVTLRALRGR